MKGWTNLSFSISTNDEKYYHDYKCLLVLFMEVTSVALKCLKQIPGCTPLLLFRTFGLSGFNPNRGPKLSRYLNTPRPNLSKQLFPWAESGSRNRTSDLHCIELLSPSPIQALDSLELQIFQNVIFCSYKTCLKNCLSVEKDLSSAWGRSLSLSWVPLE